MTEQRSAPRKIFKVKAVLAMDGAPPEHARTLDIAASGISMTVPHPLQAGQLGQASFTLLVEGTGVPIRARCKATYCIVSGGDFKAGFQFLNLDQTAMTAISRFMR